jgi:hypothetical protein
VNSVLRSDLSQGQFRLGLIAVYLLHLLIVGLFIFSVIPQVYHPADRLFWLHHGGDNEGYFELARGIMNGDIPPSKYPLGYPLLLIPFMIVLRPPFQQDLLEPVSAFWGLVMFPIGQLLLAYAARQLTGKRWLALCSVFIWTLLPLVIYGLIRAVSSPEAAEIGASHLMWMQMLSDGPTALVTLLILSIFLTRRFNYHLLWSIILGVLCGFLMLLRLTGALTVIAVLLGLLLQRRWRDAVVTAITALTIFSPQLSYNAHFFGSAFTSGYQVLDAMPAEGLFSASYLLDALTQAWARIGLLLPLAAVIPIVFGAIGLRYLWQRNPGGALIVGVSTALTAGLYSIYYFSWTGSLTRFMIPIYPLLSIIAAGCIGWLASRGKNALIRGD